MNHGQHLRALRERIGTREKVAALVGISARQIARYEREGAPAPQMYELALERLLEAGSKKPPAAG